MPQIINSRNYPSKTSNRIYTAYQYDDGSTSCNCKGWTMKRPGQDRDCRHTVTLREGTVIKVVTNAEMARMSLRGEQFEVVKRWTNGITGNTMVSLRMKEQAASGWRPVMKPSLRDLMDPAFTPPKPQETWRAKVIEPQPTRARVAFDEEV
jgi:hypothetical protein